MPWTRWSRLLELTYGDAQSNTTVFPSLNTGGTGLAVGGSSDPAAPVVGYADYLDQSGNVLCTVATPCTATPPATWYYKRVWQVSILSPNLKQITHDRDRQDQRRRRAALAVDGIGIQDGLSDGMLKPCLPIDRPWFARRASRWPNC